MKLYWTILYLLLCTQLSAQIEPCKFGQSLITALKTHYTPTQTLGYSNARDTLYSQIDNNGLNLSCIYSNFTVTLDPNVDPSISAFQGGSGINAEHVYPQSKGASQEPARSDMHNIRPSRVQVNSARGSCVFDEVTDSDTEFWYYLNTQLTTIPSTNIDQYSEKDEEDCRFEPQESSKGDIARAVFYFYTIYQNQANNADPTFFPVQKTRLLLWHRSDPVDSVEIRRNNLIASYQGNQNPFVEDTSLVARAYFMPDGNYMTGDTNCFVITNTKLITSQSFDLEVPFNYVQNELTIRCKERKVQVCLYNSMGILVKEQKIQGMLQMNISDLPKGYYYLKAQSNGQQKVFSIFKY